MALLAAADGVSQHALPYRRLDAIFAACPVASNHERDDQHAELAPVATRIPRRADRSGGLPRALPAGPARDTSRGDMEKIDLRQKLASIDRHWEPKIVGELNGQHVKLAKFSGEFLWHRHENEDELFLVLDGQFEMQFRDRVVSLRAGELIIVPRGVEHRPVAKREAQVLLFEPASTINTGNVVTQRTVARPERI
jgi:mannose-6-phosphate isomerase-like protein (cupin superfamily)